MSSFVEGKDGFIWARGVVEDRKDPLFLGRCKVRYFGYHTEDKQKMPTKDLPWSIPLTPLDPGRAHVVGPKEGDWVFAFFLDGIQAQFPVMIGSFAGYPERKANPEIGFYDPRTGELQGHQVPREPFWTQQYDDGSGNEWEELSPKSAFPDVRFLKEADTSRYERSEFIDLTIVPLKKINVLIGQTDVPTAIHPAGTGTDEHSERDRWTEKETPFNAQYPYNHVYFSEGGHIIEIDDTPNFERLHRYHRTGTFEEIHPNGLRVTKVVDNDYYIVLKSKFEHIEHSKYETVDKACHIYVNKDKEDNDYTLTVAPGGNINFTTEDGKLNVYINGDVNFYTSKDFYLKVDKNVYATVEEDFNLHVKKNKNVLVDSDVNLKVVGNANIQVDGDTNIKTGGDFTSEIDGNKYESIKGSYITTVGENYKLQVQNDIENIARNSLLNHANETIMNSALVIGNTATNINNSADTIDNVGTTDIVGDLKVSGTHEGPTPSGAAATLNIDAFSEYDADDISNDSLDEPIEPIDAPDAQESIEIPDQKSVVIDTKKDWYDYTKPSEPNGPVEPPIKIEK